MNFVSQYTILINEKQGTWIILLLASTIEKNKIMNNLGNKKRVAFATRFLLAPPTGLEPVTS